MRYNMVSWNVGETIKVGVMTLVARRHLEHAGEWLMSNKDGDKLYLFTAYQGCRAIFLDEAKRMIERDTALGKARREKAEMKGAAIAMMRQQIDDLMGGTQ